MSLYSYNLTRKYFIWKCEREHEFWGLVGIGYGFTKKQAICNCRRIKEC